MKQRLFLSAIFGFFSSVAMVANAADTFIATVNNLGTTPTPGCTVQSVGGYNGSVAFQVSCSDGSATVTATNVGQYNCAVNTSGNYYVTGNCTSYNLYKKQTYTTQTTKLTEVYSNSSALNGCSVMSAGGSGGNGYTTVAYKVTCPSDIIYVSETTSNGNCVLNNTSSPYSVSGQCSHYSVYKTTQIPQ